MHPVFVAIIALTIFAVGIYIGVSGLVTQYGVDTSDSSAAQAVCAPAAPTVGIGRPATFAISGLPEATLYFWASDKGTSQVNDDGRFRVTYSAPGAYEAYAFWLDGSRWRRITCLVTVR